ncbi:MAG: serine hydrolase domain-containing protein [Pseudonocardia sp.]
MVSTINGARIDAVLHDAVGRAAVPNVAAVAADRDGVVYRGAAGPRVPGGDEPLTPDTHFRIMSMTKMVATVAALQQVERGRLDLDAPVAEYRPEFAQVRVLDGWDGDTPRLREPASQATVRQLMTHTTGLGYWFLSEDLIRYEQVTGTPNVLSGANGIFAAPMLVDPGTEFIYGISTDWLGKVVEAASGVTLDVAIKDGVTGPLGMHDTAFQLAEGWQDTTTPIAFRTPDGWVDSGVELNQSPEYFAGGHGLYSTPDDYLRFQRALLNDGEVDGVRILTAGTVEEAFRNQIGELDFPASIVSHDPNSSCDINLGPGLKWGLGLLLNTQDVPGMRRAYSGSWAGLANTHFWVDRSAGICAAVYSNLLPFALPSAMEVYQDFERALYASL